MLLNLAILFSATKLDISNYETSFQSSSNSLIGLDCQIKLGDVSINQEKNDFISIDLSTNHHSMDIGNPELPQINKLIEIPQDANLRVEITNQKYIIVDLNDYYMNKKIIPVQPPRAKSGEEQNPQFSLNNTTYSQNKFINDELVSINEIGMMRSVKIGNLMIKPVNYNPQKNILKIYTELDFTLHFDNANLEKTNKIKEKYFSPYFESVFNQLENYESPLNRDDLLTHPIKYVIIANSIFNGYLDEFIEWKTQKGYEVIVAYTSDIGTSSSQIRSYISSLYNGEIGQENIPPSFVLLIGDTAQLTPSYSSGGHVSDLDYADMTNDNIPDIFHGRFSASTPTHLISQINKTIEYEKFLMPDPSFLSEVVMIAGVDGSFAPTHGNGQINYGINYYFNELHGIEAHTWLYPASDQNSAAAAIRQATSDGISFLNYTAHGYEQGFADPSFTVTDVYNLTNNGKYPTMIGNCCLTNAFDTGECFGEALLRAPNKGAVGYIGGSDVTYWDEDFWWGVGSCSSSQISANPTLFGTGAGTYDATFHEHNEENWSVVNSAMMFTGNLAVAESNTSLDDYYWEIYHLMGDPSLSTYMGFPDENTVNYDDFLPIGSEIISVGADLHSYIGISMNGILLGTGYTGDSGIADIELSNVNIPGIANIVITGQNKQPYFGEIVVASPEGPYLTMDAYTSEITYNSSSQISFDVENVGTDPADNLVITLSTEDEYVTVTDGTETITLAAGATTTVNGFSADISANIPNGHDITFNVSLVSGEYSWDYSFNTTAMAPEINLLSVSGDLQPGATTSVVISMINEGGAPVNYPEVELQLGQYLTASNIEFNNAYYWDMEENFNIEQLTADLTVSSSAPMGSMAELMVMINQLNSDYHDELMIEVPIGQVTADFESDSSLEWDTTFNPWTVSNQDAHTGLYSFKSAQILDNQNSSTGVTLEVTQDGDIEFWYRVSAEYSMSGNYFYDGLEFYINGQLQAQYQTETDGTSPWKFATFPVSVGETTFTWSYVKDGGGGSTDCTNTDCIDGAFIDDIIFPPVYMESDVLLGDANGDSILNILDVIAIVNMVLGGTEPDLETSDLNGDGEVTILDIIQLLNLILEN